MASGTLGTQTPAVTFAELVRLVDGELQLGDGTTPASIAVDDIRAKGNPVYDVTHPAFGAVGDGSTDDTAAIDAAAEAAIGNGVLFFPPGTYVYDGTGIDPDGQDFAVVGAGVDLSVISLGDGARFIDTDNGFDNFLFRDLTFSGGAGVLRSTYTGVNVAGMRIFERVKFLDYTGAAVSHNASDSPYWKFSRCVFQGDGFDETIGVALSGLTDGSSFTDCEFLENRVGVKLGKGGNNVYIANCDFIRWGTTRPSGPAIDIWVVPATSGSNVGQGLTVRSCKFGNENLTTDDLRVVYADEDTVVTDFGDTFPDLDSASTGFIGGHTFESFLVVGSVSAPAPFLFSTTPELRGVRIGPATAAAGIDSMPYWVEFLSAPTADLDTTTNLFGPVVARDYGVSTISSEISNGVGVFNVVDPADLHVGQADNFLGRSVGETGDYVDLLSTAVTSLNLPAGSASSTTDAQGGSNAREITGMGLTGIYGALTLANIEVGRPAWVEFDLAEFGDSPLTAVYARLQYTSNGATHWRRIVNVPSGWRRFRYPVVFREKTTTLNFHIGAISGTGDVKVGRVRIYHAREPINVEGNMLALRVAGEAELNGALNHDGSTVGFFGVTPASRPSAITQTYSTADRTLGAYTADNEGTPYTGIDNAQVGSVYAQLDDVNALRTAVENLRAFTEDAVQLLNAVVDDLQTLGLEQ